MQASEELRRIACDLALQVIALARAGEGMPDERHFPTLVLPGGVQASWRMTADGLNVSFGAEERGLVVFAVTVAGLPGLRLTVEPQGRRAIDHHQLLPDPADDGWWIERLTAAQRGLAVVPADQLPTPVWFRRGADPHAATPRRGWWRRTFGG